MACAKPGVGAGELKFWPEAVEGRKCIEERVRTPSRAPNCPHSDPEDNPMSTKQRTFGKLAITLAALALVGACSSSVLDPQTDNRDDDPDCIFINGHFVCKPR
jgi:hypothetical protein